MNLKPYLYSGSKALLTSLLAISFAVTACDKKSPHRTKPARKVGDATQKTQDPNNPQGANPTATATPTSSPNPLKPGSDKTNPEDNSTASGNESGSTSSKLSPTEQNQTGNLLAHEGSSHNGTGTLVANHPEQKTGTTTGGAATPNSTTTKGVDAKTATDQAQTQADKTLSDLQKILGQLHNIYLNAWYSVTKDKSSRPHNFFEDLATKIQNLPSLTLQEGQQTPASIRDRCEKYKVVQTIDKAQNRRRILLFDCSTSQYATILSFRVTANQWQLATTPSALEFILPNQLGYLSTIQFKPSCMIEIKPETDSARVTKAQCSEWGQELSASRARDRKTIIFPMIKYDLSATNILETQAQYLDYDGSNQVCRTGLMKRSAPSSTEVIYVDDESDGQCITNPADQGLIPPPQRPKTTTKSEEDSGIQTHSPRVQVVTQPKKRAKAENIDPETGEIIESQNEDAVDENVNDPSLNGPDSDQPIEDENSGETLPIDPTASNAAPPIPNLIQATTNPMVPIATPLNSTDLTAEAPKVPAQNLDTESQQMDFSSSAPTTNSGSTQGE